MDNTKNISDQFSNYPAFSFHFMPVAIVEVGRDKFVAYRDSISPENQVQKGTREYINGWLYGAVQAACGQLGKNTEGI